MRDTSALLLDPRQATYKRKPMLQSDLLLTMTPGAHSASMAPNVSVRLHRNTPTLLRIRSITWIGPASAPRQRQERL